MKYFYNLLIISAFLGIILCSDNQLLLSETSEDDDDLTHTDDSYSYEFSSSKLFINFSTSWDEANTSFSISNTGKLKLKFDIPSFLSDYTFDPKSGVILPSEVQNIKVSYNTARYFLEEDESIIIHFYSNELKGKDNELDYDNFYEYPVVKTNIDCKEKDISIVASDCENGYFQVEWVKNSTECYSKYSLKNETFQCKRLENHSAISIWSLIFLSITLIMLLLSITITFVKCSVIVVTVRTHPAFLLLLSLGHLLVAVADYLSSSIELDKTKCNVVVYLYVYGIHTIISSLNIILDHLKYQETQMVMSPWEKKRFYYAHCIETYVVLTIYILCGHNPWVNMLYNLEDGKVVNKMQCIPRLIDRGLLFAPSVYYSFYGLTMFYHLERLKLSFVLRWLLRGIAVFLVSVIIFIYLMVSDVIVPQMGNGYFVLSYLLQAFDLILFICYFSVKFAPIRKIGPMDQKAATYAAVLQEPITRECLYFYMKDLGQSSLLSFWLDLEYFKVIASRCSQAELHCFALRIFQTYLGKKAPYKVTVKKQLMDDVLYKMDTVQLSPKLFDEIHDYVTDRVQHFYCSKFLKSVQFLQAKQTLKWFNRFQEMPEEIQWVVFQRVNDMRLEELQQKSTKKDNAPYSGFSIVFSNSEISGYLKGNVVDHPNQVNFHDVAAANNTTNMTNVRDEMRDNVCFQATAATGVGFGNGGTTFATAASYVTGARYATLSSHAVMTRAESDEERDPDSDLTKSTAKSKSTSVALQQNQNQNQNQNLSQSPPPPHA